MHLQCIKFIHKSNKWLFLLCMINDMDINSSVQGSFFTNTHQASSINKSTLPPPPNPAFDYTSAFNFKSAFDYKTQNPNQYKSAFDYGYRKDEQASHVPKDKIKKGEILVVQVTWEIELASLNFWKDFWKIFIRFFIIVLRACRLETRFVIAV